MSAVFRASALLAPLIMIAAFGVFHARYLADQGSEFGGASLSEAMQLPPLPAWAKAPLPDFSQYSDTTEKKAAFFSYLYPRIVLANSRVLLTRHYLLTLSQKANRSPQELHWLSQLNERFRVSGDASSPEALAELIHKLDVIPPSLILAQAANESAWGTSRFARDGNNLFGQWCFSKGCGLVPLSRADGAFHEVATFESPYDSITAYIRNLNRHSTYQELRQIRAEARSKGEHPDGIALAPALSRYSERGTAYVAEIRSMIRFNNLGYFDDQFQAILEDHSNQTLRMIASSSNEDLISGSNPSHNSSGDTEG
ncbi:glucosaminidase domain-containing protein [Marinobacter zhejiangensis]|uniref:Bax protein n=1 Tax=Marinobacter zhejiangensis TaxID=488535 RepID=A0A1I4QN64_9GAMM|nr:glucosaminidase domain-containing protein [Marinobacter zhejiangensis]SFM41558.1 Bax protein [Marinobacter zhejiangensis]